MSALALVLLVTAHGFAPSNPALRFQRRARDLAWPPRAEPDRNALSLLRFLDLNDDGVLDKKDGQVAAVSLAITAASLSAPTTPAHAKGSGGRSGSSYSAYHSSSSYHSSRSYSSSRRSGCRSDACSYYGDRRLRVGDELEETMYGPGVGRARLLADAATWKTGVAKLAGDGTWFMKQLHAHDVVTLRDAGGTHNDVRAKVIERADDRAARVLVEGMSERLLPREASELHDFYVGAPHSAIEDVGCVAVMGLGLAASLYDDAEDTEGESPSSVARATRAARADFAQARERWELEHARLRKPAEASVAAAAGGTYLGVASDGETVRVELKFEKGGKLRGRGRDSDGEYVVKDGRWGASGAIAWRETYAWGEVLVRGRVVGWSKDRARAEKIEVRFASSVGVHGHVKMVLAEQ